VNDNKPEAAVVAELAKQSVQPLLNPEQAKAAAPIIVWPNGQRVDSLEKYQATPVRKRADVKVKDHDSFIDYVKRHQEPGTILFGDLSTEGASFTAVIDYHLPNADPAASDFKPGTPGWAAHKCTLALQHSPEWQAWAEKDGEVFDQAEFAQFLEENRLDIVEPEAGQIIDIAKSLEATTGSKFESAIRLDNGDRKFKYEQQTTAKAGERGELTIPEKLKLKLPVFVNGPEFPLEAFFRYRLQNGGLVLFYNIIRPHKVIEAAVEASRQAIEGETKLQVHHGSVSVPSI